MQEQTSHEQALPELSPRVRSLMGGAAVGFSAFLLATQLAHGGGAEPLQVGLLAALVLCTVALPGVLQAGPSAVNAWLRGDLARTPEDMRFAMQAFAAAPGAPVPAMMPTEV